MVSSEEDLPIDNSNKRYDLRIPEQAFKEILNDFQDVIYRYSLTCTGNQADAEDVTQEVFLKLYQNLSSLDKEKPVFHWLIVTAKNVNINFVKKRIAISKAKKNVIKNSDENKNEQEAYDLSLAINQLNDYEHEMIVLRYFENYSCEKIAKHFGVTPNAISIQLYKIKSKLNFILKAQLND